jgi:hypothetical protein
MLTLHYVLAQPWAVYVKEGNFFKSQGGLVKEWGKDWVPVMAEGIEHARLIGEQMREMGGEIE